MRGCTAAPSPEETAVNLNSDFGNRAALHAGRLDWTPSPIRGVDRRMLDRVGEEVARATSIVRYAPGSHFSAHIHGGGEEFLVLDGVFQDEHGDFPEGSYIRNPPTTSHTPGSDTGCTIFVKLWQFDPHDRTPVRLDTNSGAFVPVAGRPGVEVLPLFEDAHERVRLERWAAGAAIELRASGGIELLVLDGGFTEGGEAFEIQSWLRLPAGAPLRAVAEPRGCRVWVKTGHLVDVRAPTAT
jgi:anti-sigma factor ChrR (cupin superfamily)